MTHPSQAEAVVLFDELHTADDRRFGVATLNAPASLHALSLEMIELLYPRLLAWQQDPGVVGVVLRSSGDKAFCAGGDVVRMARAIQAAQAQAQAQAEGGQVAVAAEAQAFFEHEYRLDHLIHTFGKPVLVWGHGIVMGGGIGLIIGASHRVVSPQSRLAMPEITIGLFPDVGGSWFLGHLPGGLGAFLALTGAQMNAADAVYTGMADFVLPHEAQAALLAKLQAAKWCQDPARNGALLSHLLQGLATPDMAASNLATHRSLIDRVIGRDQLKDLAPRLEALTQHSAAWLAQGAQNFVKGSPTTAALSLALQRRARHLSLADVFRLEYNAACGCAVHSDFAEGVRALLIDKDKSPRWSPATLDEVSPALVEDHFKPRYTGSHPLADLA
ncbi:enoyl-CoA hydratase [Comamonas serinivorans]|uniref:3-hydroxyisobutyryl-CoA hydrolase n=1 Tax=Comamonas serinivorans TaxID=1082851 RepID=A0A1Y0EKA7_9BURK|nr:enoyl-CoA hydratase/isomerase family protein [Comamonas serinivorans]ARU03861.1 enoyl-CoA hydratase [Comamonas serinivorans]